MEELTRILDLDREIADKKTAMSAAQAKIDALKIELGIEQLKTEVLELSAQKEEAEILAAALLSEVKTLEFSGVQFKVKKGSKSVRLKENFDIDTIPDRFVRIKKEPDKNAMKKAKPADIAAFAEIVVSPDKVTYQAL